MTPSDADLCARLRTFSRDTFIPDAADRIEELSENGPEVVRRDGTKCSMRQWAVEQRDRAEALAAEVAALWECVHAADYILENGVIDIDHEVAYDEARTALSEFDKAAKGE